MLPSIAHEAGPWAGGGVEGEVLPPTAPVVASPVDPELARALVLLLPQLPPAAPAPSFATLPPVQWPHRQEYAL